MFYSTRKHLLAATIIFTVLAGVSSVVLVKSTVAQSEKDDETYRQLTLFGDVFQQVRSDYVEEITDEELIESAINGMLNSLDPHSAYLPEDVFEKMQVQTTGKFGGLGVEVTSEAGFLKVISPIDDTPADQAGLLPQDLIIAVDGESIVGLSLAEAVEMLRGPVGSPVTISVQRALGDPFNVMIIRDQINIKSVRSRLYESIGYIRITTFSEQTSPGLQKAVDELTAEAAANGIDQLSGFIIDLRNNPGGLLSEAISVSDAFLEQGEIVSTRGRDKDDVWQVYASSGDISGGMPIVVLINSGSASASEIVAGALKDHRRAILMGTRSFGKGSVQSIRSIPNNGAIRLTTSRYFTPSGISIQAKGITPDIEVASARIEKLEGQLVREEDLRGALEGTQDESDATANDENSQAEPIDPAEIDYQLSRALDLLRGLTIFAELTEKRK